MTRPTPASTLSVVLVVLAGAPAVAAAPCPSGGDETVSVATVAPRGELRLADGRLVRLAGFEAAAQTPGDPDLAERSRAAIAALVAGRTTTLRVLVTVPDRWGRVTAQAFVAGPGGTPAGDLAVASIGAGLGRYRAEAAAHACRDDLLAAEAVARRGALGLWRDPYYAVLGVDDHAAFAERAGTIVLARGQVRAVLPGPFRTRIVFAGNDFRGQRGLSATILSRNLKAFESQRVILPSLIGRTLLFRGLLDLRFGPHIELAGPDDLEVVDETPRADGPP